MSKTEALREEWHDTPVRGVSIGYWQGALDVKSHTSQLASSISKLKLFPSKAAIYENIFGKSKSQLWESNNDIKLGEYKVIENIDIESSKPLSKRNLECCSRSFSVGPSNIYFSGTPDTLTVESALDIASVWLQYTGPAYGFSTVQPQSYSHSFHIGLPTNHPDENWVRQVESHQQVRNLKPHQDYYLGSTMLDIFELNILSPAHLSLSVFGTTLADWIAEGNRGSLKELKKDVFAWIVPDEIRIDIRQAFLKSRYLVVPV